MKRDQIPALTSLRLIASAMIVLYHAAGQLTRFDSNPLLSAIIHQSGNAVTLFFVLSGFLITLRYYDKVAAGSFDFPSYIVKRAARILPVYFVILTITLLTSNSVAPLPVSATLTQNYFSDWKLTGLGVAWTLGVEELFYLIAPLIFMLIHRRGVVKALLGALVVMYAIGLILVQVSALTGLSHFGGFMASRADMNHFTLFGRLLDFAGGIAAARLYVVYRRRWSSNWALLGGVALIGYFWVIAIVGSPLRGIIGNTMTIAICAGIVLSLAMPTGLLARIMTWRPFVYGGKVSYAVYLIHGMPLMIPLREFDLLRYCVVVIVLSVLAYQVIEKPAQRGILHLMDHYRPRSTSSLRGATGD